MMDDMSWPTLKERRTKTRLINLKDLILSLFPMVSGSLFQSGIVLQKKEYLKLSFLQGSCLNVFECEVQVFD
jgi:hypothetical protein